MSGQTSSIIEKPWGREIILEHNDMYVLKRLEMKAGHRCSMQFHEKKTETVYVLNGPLIIHFPGSSTVELQSGKTITILPGTLHQMQAPSDYDAVYLEASTPELDDVIRVQDDYGRD